jgi:hypothetical protein
MSSENSNDQENSVLSTIGLWLFLALLTVGLVNACWTISDRKNTYQKCNDLWQLRAPSIKLLGYDEGSGVPLYEKQRMPNSFKQECKRRLKGK